MKTIVEIITVAIAIVVVNSLSGCTSQFAPSLRDTTPAVQAIQAEPTAAETIVESSATIQMVVRISGRDVVLPVGWEILAEVEDEIVLYHERYGLISIERVSDPQGVLTSISARTGEPLSCSGLGGCMATETNEELRDGPGTENGITFVMVPVSRIRTWIVGNDTVVSLRSSVDANENAALLAAADISRTIAGRPAPELISE